MTRGEIWKDFFKRNVLPAVIALFYSSCSRTSLQRTGRPITFMYGCAAVSPLAFAVCSYGLYRMDMT